VTDTHLTIRQADGAAQEVASDLLRRFFAEEGFATTLPRRRAGLAALLNDPRGAVLLAWRQDAADEPAGIATASWRTTVEHARLAQLDALYVVPEARRHGIGAALVEAVADWAGKQACTTLAVAVGPDGELSHGLTGFFTRRGFVDDYRKLLSLELRTDGRPTPTRRATAGEAAAGEAATAGTATGGGAATEEAP
jgi:aminoglycoside 6'-N-acetyltransferase I